MERASRIEVEAMLTLVEDRITANEADLEVHRHKTHHIKARQLIKRYEMFRRYLLGELWLIDRMPNTKDGEWDWAREEAKELADGADGSVDADVHPDDAESTGDVEDAEEDSTGAEQQA